MLRKPLTLLAVFCLTGSIALGLSAIPIPKGKLHVPGCSDHLNQLLNPPFRTGGAWTNGRIQLLYRGDHAHLNPMLAELAKRPEVEVTVVLHPGKRASRPATSRTSPFPADDWSVTFKQRDQRDDGSRPLPITVDVYLGGALQLSELEVPAAFTVESGGEIEMFVREHRERMAESTTVE